MPCSAPLLIRTRRVRGAQQAAARGQTTCAGDGAGAPSDEDVFFSAHNFNETDRHEIGDTGPSSCANHNWECIPCLLLYATR